MTNYVSPLLFIALLIPGGLIAARIAMTNLMEIVTSLKDVLRTRGS
jgi:hypothetical protein